MGDEPIPEIVVDADEDLHGRILRIKVDPKHLYVTADNEIEFRIVYRGDTRSHPPQDEIEMAQVSDEEESCDGEDPDAEDDVGDSDGLVDDGSEEEVVTKGAEVTEDNPTGYTSYQVKRKKDKNEKDDEFGLGRRKQVSDDESEGGSEEEPVDEEFAPTTELERAIYRRERFDYDLTDVRRTVKQTKTDKFPKGKKLERFMDSLCYGGKMDRGQEEYTLKQMMKMDPKDLLDKFFPGTKWNPPGVPTILGGFVRFDDNGKPRLDVDPEYKNCEKPPLKNKPISFYVKNTMARPPSEEKQAEALAEFKRKWAAGEVDRFTKAKPDRKGRKRVDADDDLEMDQKADQAEKLAGGGRGKTKKGSIKEGPKAVAV